MGWTTDEEYFSGQGVVLVSRRGADGNPIGGFRSIGNAPELTVSTAISTDDHKESTSGDRAIDFKLIKETKVTYKMVLESFTAKNLAMALRANVIELPADIVTGLDLNLYPGLISPLAHIKVDSVVVQQGSVVLTPYADAVTPYDYKVNTQAGSIELVDGVGDKIGSIATAVAVGATTLITVANTLVVGDKVTFKGFTGADAASLNGVTATVTVATPSNFTVAISTTAKVITVSAASKVVMPSAAVTVDYSYAGQITIDALTASIEPLWIRFEGLNTADDNAPVIVNIFKAQSEPIKDLALIADKTQSAQLDGAVLIDNTRTSGSRYYSVTKLA